MIISYAKTSQLMNKQEAPVEGKREHDMMAKVLVIGDGGVGKTALITRFTEDKFVMSYTATIGVDFKSKLIRNNDRILKMQIWDTAGQQRFKNITQAYYRGATGIVLSFSLIDRLSFQNVEKWICQIDQNASKDCSIILVGTKLDASGERVISRAEAEALAHRIGVSYMETSAKNNQCVIETFQLLGKQICEAALRKGIPVQSSNVKVHSKILEENKRQRGCAC